MCLSPGHSYYYSLFLLSVVTGAPVKTPLRQQCQVPIMCEQPRSVVSHRVHTLVSAEAWPAGC